jgi:cytochrome b561
MNPPDSVPWRHDPRTIALHWLTAALVVALWVLGEVIDDFARGTPRVMARSVHIALGVLLLVVLARRIAWRLGASASRAPVDAGLAGRAAVLVHRVLYGLLVATVLLGLANAWVRGDLLFNLARIPAFDPENKPLRAAVGALHEWSANLLLAMAGAHAAAALLHHYRWKDGVLQRMLRGRRAG